MPAVVRPAPTSQPPQPNLPKTPVLNAEGAVNGASFAAHAPLAPGTIFSLFGSFLTDGEARAAATTLPLSTKLAGTSVLVNGVHAPLFFASPQQINVQLPVELAGLNQASIVVQTENPSGTATSAPISVEVAPFSPGLFSLDQDGSGPGAILHGSDLTMVCAAQRLDCQFSAVRPGEMIAVFGTGFGQVDGTWDSGQPAAAPSATITSPIVTIGGLPSSVLFSGFAPGFVGLYQINVQVPEAMPAGTQPLIISMGGMESNAVTIPVEK